MAGSKRTYVLALEYTVGPQGSTLQLFAFEPVQATASLHCLHAATPLDKLVAWLAGSISNFRVPYPGFFLQSWLDHLGSWKKI